jgi:hypothetical protein
VGPAHLREAVGEAGVHPRREPCTEIISNINNAGKIQEPAVTE